MRILELYSGIGGCSAALQDAATVVAAVDVHRGALAVYSHNFSHPTVACAIESLSVERLGDWQADLWWMSPPCQPFTRRGLRRDLDDPRCRSLLALLEPIKRLKPRYLALENVPGFVGSRMHTLLRQTLEGAGYRVLIEQCLCPSELGVPNRRRRFYLLATRGELRSEERRTRVDRALESYLDRCPASELWVDPRLVAAYREALDVVVSDDRGAVTCCFTSAYGRSPVRSGSYLATVGGLRRFSPREILRLLAFPESFNLPAELELGRAWRLVGNSLAVLAVKTVLSRVPELADLQ